MIALHIENKVPLSPNQNMNRKRGKVNEALLPDDFKPGLYEVVCGRGHAIKSHPGNLRFLEIVDSKLDAYAEAPSKLEKSMIVTKIINSIRASSRHGGFIRALDGRYFKATDAVAREKVGMRFRDQLSGKYSSSASAKKRRRKETQAQMIDHAADIMTRKDGKHLVDRVHELTEGKTDKSEEEMQSIFNQANCELLDKIKMGGAGSSQQGKGTSSKRKLSFDNEPDVSDKDDGEESLPLSEYSHINLSDDDYEPLPLYYESV